MQIYFVYDLQGFWVILAKRTDCLVLLAVLDELIVFSRATQWTFMRTHICTDAACVC